MSSRWVGCFWGKGWHTISVSVKTLGLVAMWSFSTWRFLANGGPGYRHHQESTCSPQWNDKHSPTIEQQCSPQWNVCQSVPWPIWRSTGGICWLRKPVCEDFPSEWDLRDHLEGIKEFLNPWKINYPSSSCGQGKVVIRSTVDFYFVKEE